MFAGFKGALDAGSALTDLSARKITDKAVGRDILSFSVPFAMFEEMEFEGGRVRNANFAEYKLSSALDTLQMIPIIVEAPHKLGPYGAKGLGEPALAPTAAAIANAIYAAVGVRIKDLPITPEKILKGLREKEAK